MAKQVEGTTSVIDGKKISFSELQIRLGKLSVDSTPTYTANLEAANGSFGGTEENYVARNKATGAVYDYLIIKTPTHHHYELTLREQGSGTSGTPASLAPETSTDWTIEGSTVDQRTFEATIRTLEVDPEPWINAHLANAEGNSGTSATFEARDRRTGERWTYKVSSIGGRSSRALSRGSTKSSRPARQ